MMKTEINDTLATFTLDGLAATIQIPVIFTDGNIANEAGAPVVAPILGLPDFVSVELGPKENDYGDVIKVTLKKGLSWHDKPTPTASRTRLELISSLLQNRLYEQKIALMTDAGQRYFSPRFVEDVQAALDEMAKKGVIKTHAHDGGIRVKGYNPHEKSIVLEFKGACTTGCVGTRVSTEAVVTGNLCNIFPGAFARPKVKFIDSAPA